MISKLRFRVISEVQITLCSWSMVLLMFILTCVSDHPLCAKHSTSKQWEWDEAEWDRPFPAEDLRVIEGTQTGMGITQEKRGRRHRKKRDTFTSAISALIFLSWKKLEVLHSWKGNRHISHELPQSNAPFSVKLFPHIYKGKIYRANWASQSHYLNKKDVLQSGI